MRRDKSSGSTASGSAAAEVGAGTGADVAADTAPVVVATRVTAALDFSLDAVFGWTADGADEAAERAVVPAVREAAVFWAGARTFVVSGLPMRRSRALARPAAAPVPPMTGAAFDGLLDPTEAAEPGRDDAVLRAFGAPAAVAAAARCFERSDDDEEADDTFVREDEEAAPARPPAPADPVVLALVAVPPRVRTVVFSAVLLLAARSSLAWLRMPSSRAIIYTHAAHAHTYTYTSTTYHISSTEH